MRYAPVLRGKRYANYLVDPVFQFQAILLIARAIDKLLKREA